MKLLMYLTDFIVPAVGISFGTLIYGNCDIRAVFKDPDAD